MLSFRCDSCKTEINRYWDIRIAWKGTAEPLFAQFCDTCWQVTILAKLDWSRVNAMDVREGTVLPWRRKGLPAPKTGIGTLPNVKSTSGNT